MEIKAETTLSGNGTTRSSSPIEFTGIPGMERDKDRATYLQQLIKDQKTCLSYPNVFHHVERLLAEGMKHFTLFFVLRYILPSKARAPRMSSIWGTTKK